MEKTRTIKQASTDDDKDEILKLKQRKKNRTIMKGFEGQDLEITSGQLTGDKNRKT